MHHSNARENAENKFTSSHLWMNLIYQKIGERKDQINSNLKFPNNITTKLKVFKYTLLILMLKPKTSDRKGNGYLLTKTPTTF